MLTTSETSDHSSSLLWTPAQPPIKQAKEKVRRKQDALTLKKQTREDALTLKKQTREDYDNQFQKCEN